jgi:hypothetical protein
MNKENHQEEYSPEELAKMRAQAIANLKEEIEYLEVEEKYYDLQAKIEEAKFKRFAVMLKHSEMYARTQMEPESEEDKVKEDKVEEEVESKKSERKLKPVTNE